MASNDSISTIRDNDYNAIAVDLERCSALASVLCDRLQAVLEKPDYSLLEQLQSRIDHAETMLNVAVDTARVHVTRVQEARHG